MIIAAPSAPHAGAPFGPFRRFRLHGDGGRVIQGIETARTLSSFFETAGRCIRFYGLFGSIFQSVFESSCQARASYY